MSASPPAGDRSWTSLPTTVVATAFAGDHRKLKLRVASGDEGVVSVAADWAPPQGEPLDIYVDRSRAVVVSAGEEAAA